VTSQKSSLNKKDIESIYPLSPMQLGMLFHTLYNSESKVYLSQILITLSGNLDPKAFELAWQQVVDRHGIFRTCFVWKKSKQPLQIVRKNVTLSWVNYDWRSLSAIEQEKQLHDFLKADQDQYFELDKVPLIRFGLIRLEDQKYEFIQTGHHILADGWGSAIALKEALEFYAGIIKNQPVILPAPRPYQDYITWIQRQDQTQAESFWRQNLQGFTSPTPLTVDKPVNNLVSQSKTYTNQKFQLPREITITLKQLAKENHLTLSIFIQAAWALLLHHYSSELDVVFGATVSGRPPSFKGIDLMVGMFLNTLPVRVKIDPKVKLIPWLQQLQKEHLERDNYAYSPLVDIQKWSEIPAPKSVFESFVVFENLPFSDVQQQSIHGLRLGEMRDNGHADYPLTLIVTPGETLTGKIIYPQERFEDQVIETNDRSFSNPISRNG
jgi:Non-ribosomal peptide synthetase modules and related proteins